MPNRGDRDPGRDRDREAARELFSVRRSWVGLSVGRWLRLRRRLRRRSIIRRPRRRITPRRPPRRGIMGGSRVDLLRTAPDFGGRFFCPQGRRNTGLDCSRGQKMTPYRQFQEVRPGAWAVGRAAHGDSCTMPWRQAAALL